MKTRFNLLVFSVIVIGATVFAKSKSPAIAPVEQNNVVPKPIYEVYAIKFASITDLPMSVFIKDADAQRKTDIAMTIWLIKVNGRVVLFDTGFYREQFFKNSWKIIDFIKPTEAVALAGVKPEEVTDVIISHMHWDHADGLDLFPKAKVWIQKDEYIYYTGEAWHGPNTHGGIEGADVGAMLRANIEGRVNFVNGDAQEILPGVIAYIGGKHTYQSQFIGVNTKQGTVILASDNMYLYENLDKHVPISQTLDAESNLRAQDRMKQLAVSLKFIIPGHDPEVFNRFPKVADRVVKIE